MNHRLSVGDSRAANASLALMEDAPPHLDALLDREALEPPGREVRAWLDASTATLPASSRS